MKQYCKLNLVGSVKAEVLVPRAALGARSSFSGTTYASFSIVDIRLKRAVRIVKRRQSIGKVHISTTIKRKLVHRVRLLSRLALDT